ncbi:hypothetical protein F4802DRAFT_592801 [Xylaria palmicola]|nr:hypothetical protein F4802DRAFT_592801 [Xylaria palmicola]
MPFLPHPAVVRDYQDRYPADSFVLGSLSTNVYQQTIEKSLRQIQGCPGNVTVYWPRVERNNPSQKHRGWCHVLCATREIRDLLKGVLHGHRMRPNSAPWTTKRNRMPIAAFERITHITAAAITPAATAAATTITTPAATTNVAAAATTTATTTTTAAAAAAGAAESTARPSHVDWVALEDVYARIQRLLPIMSTTVTPETWHQATEVLGAARDVIGATIACKDDEAARVAVDDNNVTVDDGDNFF